MFEFIVPPKQGLKLHTLKANNASSMQFEFIVPPKQGLKPSVSIVLVRASIRLNL